MIQDPGAIGEMPLRHLQERLTTMKLNALSLSLGLVLLVMSQVSARAADWNYGAGSLKDGSYAASIAVPAPAPIPVYHADYYFRADFGIGMGDTPDVRESGLVFGQDSDSGSFGMLPAWLDNDSNTFLTYGVGVGTYVNDHLRLDFTADYRKQKIAKFNGSYSFTTGGGANSVSGTTFDETKLRGGIFLLNAYYDFSQFAGLALRPYIGGGIGFAWNNLTRVHRTTELTCNPAPCAPNIERGAVDAHDKSNTLTLATMATVGMSYKINHNTLLDMNYRFLYVDGVHVGLGINGGQFGGASVVEIDDTFEHQLRAGIRYEIN